MRQRLQKHLAVHNETRSPWGPIDLRVSVGAWSARDRRSFAQFLDAVESDLRHTPAFDDLPTFAVDKAAAR